MIRIRKALKYLVILLLALVLADLLAFAVTSVMVSKGRKNFAKLVDLTKDTYRPKRVPEDQNSHELIGKALEKGSLSDEEYKFLKGSSKYCVKTRAHPLEITPEEIRAALPIFDQLGDRIKAIRKAVELPYYARRPEGFENTENVAEWLIPDLTNARYLTNLSCALAITRAYEGKEAKAYDALYIAQRMREYMHASEPFLIVDMMEIAFASLYFNAVRDVSRIAGDISRIDNLLAELKSIDIEARLIKCLECEAFFSYHIHRDRLLMTGEYYRFGVFISTRVVPSLGHFDELYTYDFWQYFLDVAKKPYHEILAEPVPERFVEPPRHYIVSRVCLPMFMSAIKKSMTVEARRRLLMCSLAMMKYEARNGSLPETLDDISPLIGSEATIDPCSGKPFVYRVKGTGYELYSVGKIFTDDKGDKKLDIAWSWHDRD